MPKIETGVNANGLTREQALWQSLRKERGRRIELTDYLFLADCAADDAKMAKAREYRQALRDLPAQEGAPWDGGGDKTPWPELD